VLGSALVSGKIFAFILFTLLGIVFTATLSLCRAFYSELIPSGERAEYFSVYIIFERMGAVIGPLLWSTTVSLFMFAGESVAYRVAMGATALITAFSILVFRKVEQQHK
jgi:MFS-type transporter involved in bile tolerance (Atg22 family)